MASGDSTQRKRNNYKILVDPELKKGHKKVYRLNGKDVAGVWSALIRIITWLSVFSILLSLSCMVLTPFCSYLLHHQVSTRGGAERSTDAENGSRSNRQHC